MLREARQAPAAVAHLLAADAPSYQALAACLRKRPPGPLMTLGRGSSGHAAAHTAYLLMARLGRPVTSLPMSLLTQQDARIACEGGVVLAYSQSGESPDLLAAVNGCRAGGAIACAWVNAGGSPLAGMADWVLPLHAGTERSVAATKSFIAQLVAGVRLVTAWQGDAHLAAALGTLPETLELAVARDWSGAVETLRQADRMFVVGRGLGLPVAQEAALKLKETCGIQAEAYSAAELRHGPITLVGEGYPLLFFAPRGPGQASVLELARSLRADGARVMLAAPAGTPGVTLPMAEGGVPELDAISAIQSFYPLVEAVARARGRDPDAPPRLRKVTCTN